MSIEKKSLISTLKTTKKANAVSSELKPSTVTSKKAPVGMRRAYANKRNIANHRAVE
ncbi:MAG TPA: hypothetical protein VL128_04190 [Candidatus Eisenbacteria bacterium]|nr:hypothetical protein [Candidatus Eisenbacteria bacterium]